MRKWLEMSIIRLLWTGAFLSTSYSAQACVTCGCRCLDAAPPEGWEIPQSASDLGGSGSAALPIQPGSWTLAIMPDTQIYSQNNNKPYTEEVNVLQHFYNQTQWIADHKVSHNIKYVLHEGDIINVANTQQWINAKSALSTLDTAGVPYAIAPGNHDYTSNRGTMFQESQFFGPGSPYASQSSIGGFFEAGKTDNSWHTFNANGQDWVIITMEYGPRDQVVAWANQVLERPELQGHLAMMVTHAYMYNDDTIYDWATKGSSQSWSPYTSSYVNLPGGVNDGQELWDGFVKLHDNFRFVFNGHVLGDGTGYRGTLGDGGNAVHQMLANYQMKTQGGNGDMRLLEFLADGETVIVRTYSPSLDRYDMAADQTFTLNMNEVPPPPPPKPIYYHAISANLVAVGETNPVAGNVVQAVQIPQSGDPSVSTGQLNRGDFQPLIDNRGLKYQDGILLATVTQHDRPDFANRRATVEAGRNPYGDGLLSLSIMEAGVAGDTEINFNTSLAWFEFAGGWTGAHVNGATGTLAASHGVAASQVTKTGTGRYNVNLGANAQNEGMLFVIGNNNDDIVVQTGLLAGGTTWDIRTQDSGANFSATGEDKDWSFLYLPYDTPNLVGGYYDGIANSTIQSAGNFTMNRLGTGQYELTVTGESPTTGMLVLSLANQTTIGPTTAPDDNILVYQPGANGKFLINSYDITGTGTTLENTKFAWAFIGFDDPISQVPPPPLSELVMTVDRSTSNLTLTNAGTATAEIRQIRILSGNGSLDPNSWLSITDNYDTPGGDGSVDEDDAWTELSNTAFNLTEREQSGGNGGVIGVDQSVDLGNLWKKSRLEDVMVEIELVNGDLVLANVNFINGPDGSSYVRSDLNTDGLLTAADWNYFYPNMLANLNSMTGLERALAGDLNGDGKNDIADFVLFKADFELANGSGSFNAMLNGVPEPSTTVLLSILALIGGVWLRAKRR